MRRMIAAMLQDEGYEVALAVDGREGLARAREAAPELILSDYEMPELDGPGLCRELKADPALRPIPVIMLTSLGATESKVVGLDAGADDYIEKPKSPQEVQEVFARIRAQLRIADLRRELAERNRQLEVAQAKLDLELNLARKVQMGLMPKPPKAAGRDPARGPLPAGQPPRRRRLRLRPARRRPARRPGRRHLRARRQRGAAVGDGQDAGRPADCPPALPPGQVLAGLDAALGQYFPEGYFCTGFYLVIDEATGAFDYAGVGHPPALVVGPGGTRQLDSEPRPARRRHDRGTGRAGRRVGPAGAGRVAAALHRRPARRDGPRRRPVRPRPHQGRPGGAPRRRAVGDPRRRWSRPSPATSPRSSRTTTSTWSWCNILPADPAA